MYYRVSALTASLERIPYAMVQKIQDESLCNGGKRIEGHEMSTNHIRPIFTRKIQTCNSQQK